MSERGRLFGTVADDYDRLRPPPPDRLADVLGDLSGTRILEIGAGTGKLTRFLLGLGAEVTAIEPDDDMREVLERRSPTVEALDARGEDLPFNDNSFDLVISSSVWHWLEHPRADLEATRVLIDEGSLVVLWNGFSRDEEWVREILSHRETTPHVRERGWRAEFDRSVPVEIVEHIELHWTWRRTIEELVAVFGTYSGVLLMDDAERRAMYERVEELVIAHSDGESVEVPMTLRGTIARRRAR